MYGNSSGYCSYTLALSKLVQILGLTQGDEKQPGFAQLSTVAPLLQGSELALLKLVLPLCIALCPMDIVLLTSMVFKTMVPET